MPACLNRLAALCILLLQAKSSLTSSSGCRIEYVIQPSSAPVNCSPYSVSNISVIIVTLECTVRQQNGSTEEYEIRWFRENTTGEVEELGRGSTETVCEDTVSSRYHDRDLLNQEYSPSLLGKYWCQVINTTADPDQPLMRSNVFTLLAPGDYNGTTCTTVQALANTTCADMSSNSTANISTSPLTSVSPTIISKPFFMHHSTTAGGGGICVTITIPEPMASFTQLPSNPDSDSAIIPVIVGVGVTTIFATVTAVVTVIIILKVCLKKKKKEDEDDYMTMTNIRRMQSSTRSELNPYDVCYFDKTIPESSSITVQTNPSFSENDTPPQGDCEETRSQVSEEYTNMDSIAKGNGKILLNQPSTNESEYMNMTTVDQVQPSSDQEDTSQYQALDISTTEYVSVYTRVARKLKTSAESRL